MNINHKQGAIFGAWMILVFVLNYDLSRSFFAALATTSTIGDLALLGILIGEAL